MTVLKTSCTRCECLIELPLSSLLLAHVLGDDLPGRVAYICFACEDIIVDRVPPSALTFLEREGCDVPIVGLRVPHPEGPMVGPALTMDDLLDLHEQLASDDGAPMTEDLE